MLMGERRGRASPRQTEEFLIRLGRLRIDLAPVRIDAGIFSLARVHRLTFYDAAYLELAQREAIALATLDRDLAKAASVERVQLVIAI
jgi:predicted nucleic acid-binding protein